MAKGQPDFGSYAPTETIVGMSDLGELAARLGSIVTFDRRGNVIWLDDFESGVHQWRAGGNIPYSVDWDGNYAKMGGFSCKLTTRALADADVHIMRYIGYPAFSPIGVEVSYSYKQNWKSLEIWMWICDGSDAYYSAILYDHANTKLQYLDSGGIYQDVPDGSYTSAILPEQFDTLKFVSDLKKVKYKDLIVNSQVFDLSALSFQTYVDLVSTPHMEVTIKLFTSIDTAAIAYIDDVIITQNE